MFVIPCCCIIWVKIVFPVLRIVLGIKSLGLVLNKLLNCAPCLSFWVSTLYFYLIGEQILQCAIVYILTKVIYKIYEWSEYR